MLQIYYLVQKHTTMCGCYNLCDPVVMSRVMSVVWSLYY